MATKVAGKFEPSALATPANAITAVRLLATLPVLVLIVHLGVSWVAALAWAAVASTDFLDGWVARRQGATTSGAFLDPLADKVLVLGALAALAATGLASWIPVLLIAGPGGGHQRLPVRRGPPRRVGAGPAAGEGEDRGPGPGRGVDPPATDRAASPRHRPGAALDLGRAGPGERRPVPARQPAPPLVAPAALDDLPGGVTMRCEVLAIGTELLLGQVVDTNSAWIGEQLALAGIDSHFQVKVGDNQARIVAAIRQALARSDAVICCGGLGPTQDDITREAIAEVLGVPLEVDEEVAARIEEMFAGRGRAMAANNLRQAEVPRGADRHPAGAGHGAGPHLPARGPQHLRRPRSTRTRCGR